MRPLHVSFALSAVLLVGEVSAATVVVANLGDAPGVCPGATCTLRAAITAAQEGDTVVFDSTLAFPSSLILGGSELTIAKDLTVLGPGPDRLTLSAGAQSRVLQVTAGSVRIVGLGLANGLHRTAVGNPGNAGRGHAGESVAAAEGGCVRVSASASLHLERVALVSCQARGGNGGNGANGTSGVIGGAGGTGGDGGSAFGGAIASFGELTLIESSIQGALALAGTGGRGGDGGSSMMGIPSGMGGAGGNGGTTRGAALYIAAGTTLVAHNSTVTAGTASGGTGGDGGVSNGLSGVGGDGGAAEGGGAYLGPTLALADLEFVSLGPATMQAGPGGAGGGGAPAGAAGLARGEAVFADTTPRVRYAVFAGNDAASDCHGAINASGTNFASDASCGFALQGTYDANFFGPGVQEIAGRAVLRTRPGALPIDAAADCADLDGMLVQIDGVGRPRPVDGNDDGSAQCDLGAFEFDLRVFRDGFEPAG